MRYLALYHRLGVSHLPTIGQLSMPLKLSFLFLAIITACQDASRLSTEEDQVDRDSGVVGTLVDRGQIDLSLSDASFSLVDAQSDPHEDSFIEDMGEEFDSEPPQEDAGVQDMESLPNIEIWEREGCELPTTNLEMIDSPLERQGELDRWRVGGPLSDQNLLISSNGSEGAENYGFITLQGGALHLQGPHGQLVWRSEGLSLKALWGLYDFDGDGTLEVLASTTLRVHIFRLSNGEELWRSSPEDIGQGETLSSISKVAVSRESSELYPSLYIADAGCSTAGTGYGVVYRFPEGFATPIKQSINLPRVSGRCSRWQTISHGVNVHGESPEDPLIMITDQHGLHGFSSTSGQRVLCGHYPQDLISGRLPHIQLSSEGEGRWVSILDDQVSLLTIRDRVSNDQHCSDEERVISPLWTVNLKGATPLGLMSIDLNNDGFDELWINHHVEEVGMQDRWGISILDGATGVSLAYKVGLSILGRFDWTIDDRGELQLDLLVSQDHLINGTLGSIPSTIQLSRINISELATHITEGFENPLLFEGVSLWETPLFNAKPLWRDAPIHGTSEFKELSLIDHENSPAVLISYDLLESGTEFELGEPSRYLIVADGRGVINRYGVEGRWGALKLVCSPQANHEPCALPDRVIISEIDGQISILNSNLEKLGHQDEGVSLVTGRSAFTFVDQSQEHPILLTQSSTGMLSAYALNEEASRVSSKVDASKLWSRQVSVYNQRGHLMPEAPLLSSRGGTQVVISHDQRRSNASDWVAWDLYTGEEIWRHRLSTLDWRSEKQTLMGSISTEGETEDLIFRLERALTDQAIPSLLPCEGQENLYGLESMIAVNVLCPEVRPTPRVIHALEASTGQCKWRTTIHEMTSCVQPSLQHLNLLDIDQDGSEELYLFESNSLRWLDPRSGELIGSAVLPFRPNGRFVSGGWLEPYQGGLLRFGTYSPPDLYVPLERGVTSTPVASLEATWFGQEIEGLRTQSWLFEWVITTAQGLWLSPGVNRPLIQYNQAGQLERALTLDIERELGSDQAQVHEIALSEIHGESTNITGLKASSDGGIIATTEEGGLFILDHEGGLVWGKVYQSEPSLPLFVDWDRDGAEEWLISTNDGELIFYDQDHFRGISELWEASCLRASQCSSTEDSDHFEIGEPICVGWIPIEGIEGAMIQLQTSSGSRLSDWWDLDQSGAVKLNDLPLIANNSYRFAIKGYLIAPEGERLYTTISYSDGFMVIDDQAPRVSLSTDRETVRVEDLASAPLMINYTASDRVFIAGWSLVVYSESEQLVSLIRTSSTQQREVSGEEQWFGTDRYGSLVEPGRYKIFFAATDAAGNQTNTEVWLSIE